LGKFETLFFPVVYLTSSRQKIKALEERLESNSIHSDPRCAALYDLYHRKQGVVTIIKGIKKKIQSAHDVMQMDELKCRKRVLRRLGFTTAEDVVDRKGRVACEISTGDELLLTEMIFNNVFNSLSPEYCAALLSCFVFSEKVRALPVCHARDVTPFPAA
jgi:ATP-dependent RNA helicase DOB1